MEYNHAVSYGSAVKGLRKLLGVPKKHSEDEEDALLALEAIRTYPPESRPAWYARQALCWALHFAFRPEEAETQVENFSE